MGLFEDLKMIDEYSNVNNKEENDMATTTIEENIKKNNEGYGDIFEELIALGEATNKDKERNAEADAAFNKEHSVPETVVDSNEKRMICCAFSNTKSKKYVTVIGNFNYPAKDFNDKYVGYVSSALYAVGITMVTYLKGLEKEPTACPPVFITNNTPAYLYILKGLEGNGSVSFSNKCTLSNQERENIVELVGKIVRTKNSIEAAGKTVTFECLETNTITSKNVSKADLYAMRGAHAVFDDIVIKGSSYRMASVDMTVASTGKVRTINMFTRFPLAKGSVGTVRSKKDKVSGEYVSFITTPFRDAAWNKFNAVKVALAV